MTEKQQKIGLLSSSKEESALAVSLSQLNQIILNAPRWLAARWCIKNHALVLTEYTSKWIKVSLFFLCNWGGLCLHSWSASSVLCITPVPVQVAHLQANINPWSQIAEWGFGWENASTKLFTMSPQKGGNVIFFYVLWLLVEQRDSY